MSSFLDQATAIRRVGSLAGGASAISPAHRAAALNALAIDEKEHEEDDDFDLDHDHHDTAAPPATAANLGLVPTTTHHDDDFDLEHELVVAASHTPPPMALTPLPALVALGNAPIASSSTHGPRVPTPDLDLGSDDTIQPVLKKKGFVEVRNKSRVHLVSLR